MTRRALLVGSETYGLTGCEADVALMRGVLERRGFDQVDVRVGADASRAGIIDGIESMIAAIGPGDAIVVYYSGHGGRVTRPDFEQRRAAGLSTQFQFIVPSDLDASAAGDFRGILSEELTVLQRRATDAFRALGEVPNVTTILDCCHSGYMARAIDSRPKSLGADPKMFRIVGIRDHAAALSADAEANGAATNPDVVRIVACQAEQSAFELPSKRGGEHGALTDALATVLDELGTTDLGWSTVADLVRRRVRTLVPEQRPDVEGPADRVMFSVATVPDRSAFSLAVVDGVARIESAAILGIAAGDEFDLVRPGATDPSAHAVVRALVGGDALLQVDEPGDALADLLAVPRRVSVPRIPIAVATDLASRADVVEAIDASGNLRVHTDRPGAAALASVAADGDHRCVLDGTGARWRTDRIAADPAGTASLVDTLEAIAVGERLLDLPSGTGQSKLDPVIEIRFGAIDSRGPRELAPHGERLAAGTPVTLAVRNTSHDELFVWLFDVGVSGRSSLLTNAGRSGTRLGPVGDGDDALDAWGPDGEPLFWPDDVPTDSGGRQETFVVVTADRRGDLSSLASKTTATARGSTSALDALLDEVRIGTREVRPTADDEPALRYRVDHIEFVLEPERRG